MISILIGTIVLAIIYLFRLDDTKITSKGKISLIAILIILLVLSLVYKGQSDSTSKIDTKKNQISNNQTLNLYGVKPPLMNTEKSMKNYEYQQNLIINRHSQEGKNKPPNMQVWLNGEIATPKIHSDLSNYILSLESLKKDFLNITVPNELNTLKKIDIQVIDQAILLHKEIKEYVESGKKDFNSYNNIGHFRKEQIEKYTREYDQEVRRLIKIK